MKTGRAIGLCGLALLCSGLLRADFMASSESAVFDPISGLVTFRVTFTEAPDFFTTDSFGRPASDFQIYVFGDQTLNYPTEFDSIIRGAEIYRGQGIPIRNATPSVAEPQAGGWGAIRGTVPFTLEGTSLTFSAPLAVLSNHSTDGFFSYNFQTDSYGRGSQFLRGQTIVSPEPVTTPIIAALAISFLLLAARKSRGDLELRALAASTSGRLGQAGE